MKVAISARGDDIDSLVDPRFGRARWFVVLGVSAVVTGDIGPNAFRVLSAAGVRVYASGEATVWEALTAVAASELRELSGQPSPAAPERR